MQVYPGFRLNSVASMPMNALCGKLAAEFITSKKSPDTLWTIVHSILGEGWRAASEELDKSGLMTRAEKCGVQPIPEPVRVPTAGVDVQRRIEITLIGFSGVMSFVLGHRVVWSDPEESTIWAERGDALKSAWRHPLGRKLGVEAAAVDAGEGETVEANACNAGGNEGRCRA
jgi:phage terminase large subunit GpA-like protein